MTAALAWSTGDLPGYGHGPSIGLHRSVAAHTRLPFSPASRQRGIAAHAAGTAAATTGVVAGLSLALVQGGIVSPPDALVHRVVVDGNGIVLSAPNMPPARVGSLTGARLAPADPETLQRTVQGWRSGDSSWHRHFWYADSKSPGPRCRVAGSSHLPASLFIPPDWAPETARLFDAPPSTGPALERNHEPRASAARVNTGETSGGRY